MRVFMFLTLALVSNLYSAFVAQHLWNWFVVAALHAPTMSYGTMYGVLLFVPYLSSPASVPASYGTAFLRLGALVASTVPSDRREKVDEALSELTKSVADVGLIVGAIFGAIAGQVIRDTLLLVLGYLIAS